MISKEGNVKRVRMIEFRAEAKKLPESLFDYAVENDSNPIVHSDVEATEENVDKAKAWLASKKSTAEYWSGYAMGFYSVTVYAIEYYTADEDGEFIEGSDFDEAEEAVVG